MKKILVGTHNKGKFREISYLISKKIKKISPSKLNIKAPKETGKTFQANAELKANYFSRFTSLPVISDDSGLYVDSLNGEPGVKSARYAGEQATDQDNIEKLITKLTNEENRSASFKTVLFFYDGVKEISTEGVLDGEITLEPRGDNGFGYDPVFQHQERTLAELSLDEKTEISHRNIACIKMVELLNEEL